jgi:hypothetical protein
MAIEQISRIQIRSGLQQQLPILKKGEFGWCVDTLRLFIGNGTIADGAPFEGNTEILTVGGGGSNLNLTPVTGAIPVSIAHPQDGYNATFVLPVTPYPGTLIVWKNVPQAFDPTLTVGYNITTLAPNTVVFAQAPQPTDALFYQCWIA